MGTSSSGGNAGASDRRRAGPGFRGAIDSVLPGDRFGDERAILAGTGQNVVGVVAAVLAGVGTQVLITRALGAAAFGVVTLATQFAFVAAAATRFGMDMAAIRRVAIAVGTGASAGARAIVARAVAIAGAVSLVVAVAVVAGSGHLARAFASGSAEGEAAFRAAAVALPFVALAQVYLGATRGLKIMRHTLYVQWLGQPIAWIVLMVVGWIGAQSVGVSVLAYAGSWAAATATAAWLWRRATTAGAGSARVGSESPQAARGEVGGLVRYGAPRAPAALFSQLLFWTDLYVLARVASSAEVGVYAAAVRAAQLILLFLVSVNLMFSPFVADLYARGMRDRLDALFKSLTRWMLAATLPFVIVLAIAPQNVLRLFGEGFASGRTALLILLAGQLVNVATGSVGFILIMVGRTGWDLLANAVAVATSIAAAAILAPRYGMEGAAVAGALALTLSNVLRLWLVWRFVGIQPFTRAYGLLAIPAGAAAIAAWLVHRSLAPGPWQVDLVATALAGAAAYALALLAAGLPPGERRAAGRLIAAVARRRA